MGLQQLDQNAQAETLDELSARLQRRLEWCRRLSEDQGQAALEFALCAPVLLLVVTGIISLGMTLSNYTTLVEAVNTGARQFAISRGQQGDPCATVLSTINAAAPTLVKSDLVVTFQVFSTATNSKKYTGTCNGATLNAAEPVIVNATYPCSLSWYGVIFKSAATCKLQAQTAEVLQ